MGNLEIGKDKRTIMTDYDPIELAWAAGFFDGEGNANGYIAHTAWQVRASVTQIHLDTLERFQRAIGGLGLMYGPYQRPNGNSPQFTLRITGYERVQQLMVVLWPYLFIHKKEQFKIALIAYRSSYRPPPSTREQRDRINYLAKQRYKTMTKEQVDRKNFMARQRYRRLRGQAE